eukprot:tig00021434_g21310.t1
MMSHAWTAAGTSEADRAKEMAATLDRNPNIDDATKAQLKAEAQERIAGSSGAAGADAGPSEPGPSEGSEVASAYEHYSAGGDFDGGNQADGGAEDALAGAEGPAAMAAAEGALSFGDAPLGFAEAAGHDPAPLL